MMEETMIMETEETIDTVVEDTELATYDENIESSDSTATKVAVGTGIATILIGGFLVGKKLVKKHKAKKAAERLGKEAEELGAMLEQYAELQKTSNELKRKIDSMMPQSVDNMETEKKEEK